MVIPSSQPTQPQPGQWQPVAMGQPPSPVYPPGGHIPPAPYHLPPPSGPGGAKKIIIISNLSLFSIAVSLIFFGAFTFLGGFLLGMWLEGTKIPPYGLMQRNVHPLPSSSPAQEGVLPPSHPYPQNPQASNLSQMLGTATEESINGIPIPTGVPNFLTPFAAIGQQAAATQAGTAIQHAAQHAQEGPSSPFSPPSSTGQASLPSHTMPAAHTAAPHSQPKGQYAVHLGSFAAKENAEALQNRLQVLGYSTYIKEGKSLNGDLLYQVYSGHYSTYTMALKEATHFVSRNIPGARVVKLSTTGGSSS